MAHFFGMDVGVVEYVERVNFACGSSASWCSGRNGKTRGGTRPSSPSCRSPQQPSWLLAPAQLVIVVAGVQGALIAPPLGAWLSKALPTDFRSFIAYVMSMTISVAVLVPLLKLTQGSEPSKLRFSVNRNRGKQRLNGGVLFVVSRGCDHMHA